MKELRTRVTVCLVICLCLFSAPALLPAQETGSTIDLAVSENFIMKTTGVLARVMVDNPEIAMVKALGSRELLISARKIGTTTVRFRDDSGKDERMTIIVEAESSAQQQVRALIAAIADEDAQVRAAAALSLSTLTGNQIKPNVTGAPQELKAECEKWLKFWSEQAKQG